MKALFLALLFSTQCFAWGPTGHRVVGELAEKLLEPEVGIKVRKLLEGQSLSRVSTWPDEIKSDPENYKYTYNWHYTDWPDDVHEHSEANSSGVLITSINEQLAVLKNPKVSADKKAFAIKFLVHLVGDLHMPLHVGNGLDYGGNNCKVLFHGKPTNLHALWDEGLIDFTNLSYTELTKYVAQGRKIEDVRAWKKSTLMDWTRESKELRAQLYPADVVAPPAPMSIKNYCRRDIPVPQEEMPKLAYEYSFKFVPIVELRLFQAGIRLAQLLNQNLK